MPLYDYRCSAGHVTEHLHRDLQSRRPNTQLCDTADCRRQAHCQPVASPRMRLSRRTLRRHSQPDEWDPATNPKLRPARILQGGDE